MVGKHKLETLSVWKRRRLILNIVPRSVEKGAM
jgi:hypothetical protein